MGDEGAKKEVRGGFLLLLSFALLFVEWGRSDKCMARVE